MSHLVPLLRNKKAATNSRYVCATCLTVSPSTEAECRAMDPACAADGDWTFTRNWLAVSA